MNDQMIQLAQEHQVLIDKMDVLLSRLEKLGHEIAKSNLAPETKILMLENLNQLLREIMR